LPATAARYKWPIIVGLSLAYLAVCVFGLATTGNWLKRTFPGFLLIRNNYVATVYFSDWAGYRAGIHNIDRVTMVDGWPVTMPREIYDYVARLKPGTPVHYTLVRGKTTLEFTVPASVLSVADYLLIFPVAMTLGLFFLASGLVVFYLKPESPPSWFILWGFLAQAMLYGANGERCTNGLNFIPNIFMPMMATPLLIFSFYFPLQLRVSRAATGLMILITFVTTGGYLYGYLTGHGFLFFDRLYLFIMFLSVLLSASIQTWSYFTTDDQLIRQKSKVVIYGFILCFIIGSVVYFGLILPRRNNFYSAAAIVAIVPLTLGYAVIKHNLFDVDVFLQRSLTYVLLSGIVVALFLGLGSALSYVLQGLTGGSSQVATIFSTLAIVVIVNPLRTRIDRVVDRRFFREKYEYTATIRKAGAILAGIINLDELLCRLLDTVIDAIKIERGLILLKTGDEFTPAAVSGAAAPAALPAGHPFLARLEALGRPVQRNDVEEGRGFEADRAEHLAAMDRLGIVLAVPVLYEGRLIGMLGLGAKKSGSWYTSEDMELLGTLMIQTAVSIENARKVEELKRMVELETSYRELQKLDDMKDHFLSMVSHDLRTPMTSIRGYAALMNSKAGKMTEDRQKHFSSIIVTEADRLTRLINDLLDLQRFEAGKMHLEIRPEDLVPVIRNAAQSFRGAAMQKGIELAEALPDEPVTVDCDADRMAQVISNLLSNAIKFTPEGGRVEARMERCELSGAAAVRVAVKDNGPGIPKDQQGRLFSKFQQVEGGELVVTKEKGSGLGLALCKDIVGHHGGEVGMESEPGQGSTFYFILKLAATEETTHAQGTDRGR